MLGEKGWSDRAWLRDGELALVRARVVAEAAPSWADDALTVRSWHVSTDVRGRVASIHVPGCPLARQEPVLHVSQVDSSVLDLAPRSAFCTGCVSPVEFSWWNRAHGIFKLYAPLQLARELEGDSPSWPLLLRALGESDRLLSAARYPEEVVDATLVEYCVVEGERVLERAPQVAASLPGFGVRSDALLARLASSGEALDVHAAFGDVFDGPLPSPVQRSGDLVVLGLPNVVSSPVAALVTLVRPVLARSGTKRLVLVSRPEALLLAGTPPRRRDQREYLELPDRVLPGLWETALSLWEPWEGTLLSSLENAFQAAEGVLASPART